MRQPQAAERRPCGQRAEDHRARQARWQQLAFPRSPGHHEIDIECDADAEQERQCNDVLEIERQTYGDADAERGEPGQHERRERQHHVGRPAQSNRE